MGGRREVRKRTSPYWKGNTKIEHFTEGGGVGLEKGIPFVRARNICLGSKMLLGGVPCRELKYFIIR